MALQHSFHAQFGSHPPGPAPLSYVYAPITLPVLSLLGSLPAWLAAGLYCVAYFSGLFAQIRVGLHACHDDERRSFLYLAPAAAFFPACLVSDTVWSGNVAFILYGAVLSAALVGWRRGTWRWFYLAVLLTSFAKLPLLSLLALPVFSARRQWLFAGATALLSLAIFALQSLLCPALFHHFLQAVELQFSYNRDFGVSPAGVFAGALFDRNLPYSASTYLFLAYALPIFVTLSFWSRRFLRGELPLRQWLPVLLVGVLLLNPRIMQYDEVCLALPMALIVWRFFRALSSARHALYASVAFIAIVNVLSLQKWNATHLLDAPLLLLAFCAGVWNLMRKTERPHPQPSTPRGSSPGETPSLHHAWT